MATLNEISSADQYAGNATLGGGNPGALQIDTKPIEQLGIYTQFYNKTLYDQTLADRDAKIAEVAKLSQIDLNNLLGKDKDEMVKSLDDIKSYARQYAVNPNRSIDQELEWQTKLNKVETMYDSGKNRAMQYYQQTDDANKNITDATERDVALKDLKDRFDSTGIMTPVASMSTYKPVVVDVPDPEKTTTSVVTVGANTDITSDYSFYNPNATAQKASVTALALPNLFPKEGTPEYNKLSPAEKYQAKMQATKADESQAQVFGGATDIVNKALQEQNTDGSYKYFKKDANGNQQFDFDKFKQDYASNSVILPPVQAVMNLTKYSTDKKNQVISGAFLDKGVGYKVPTNMTPDFFNAGIVNITPDGLKPNQLIQAGSFSKYSGDVVSQKATHTGDQRALQGIGIAQSGETERTKLNIAKDIALANLPYDKLKLSMKDAKSQTPSVTEAQQYTTDLMNKLKSAANENGDIDLNKAQLTAQDYEMLGLGNIDQKTGKFTFDSKEAIAPGTKLRYDTATNKVIVPKIDIKTGFFSDNIHKPERYIDFDQIAANKFYKIAALSDSKEASSQLPPISGAENNNNQTSPAASGGTQKTQAELFMESLKK